MEKNNVEEKIWFTDCSCANVRLQLSVNSKYWHSILRILTFLNCLNSYLKLAFGDILAMGIHLLIYPQSEHTVSDNAGNLIFLEVQINAYLFFSYYSP